jgi:SAM-dependent methyltransferase
MSPEMIERDYDQSILSHYRKVAQEAGSDPTSGMADQRTRELETNLICDFVDRTICRYREEGKDEEELQLIDVGCGNGYTLEVLCGLFPKLKFAGFEYTPELRKIAEQRFPDQKVRVFSADVRNPDFAGSLKAHIVICQRVLINLLNSDDQANALDNIVESARPKGYLLFIEAFQSGLDRLNEARAEFDLSSLMPLQHNLYLPDSFFSRRPDLRSFDLECGILSNFLSTHYFVSRVFHPAMLGNREMKRNSHWVTFFSQALTPAVGAFSPLRACAFQRSA